MKRILPIITMLLLTAVPALAQATDSDDNAKQSEKKTTEILFNANNKAGDQNIRIAIGTDFPINFPSLDKLFTEERKLSVGGMGSIGYQYFVTDMFAVGGEIGFGFNVSIGAHVFNFVPITATFSLVPTINHFEFPVTVGVGIATHTYAGNTYFPGLVVHPQVGVTYRINGSWSAGLELGYLYLPEFNHLYDKEAENIHGQFATMSLVARYFF